MIAVEKLVIGHLDLWTTAIKRKSTAGRGSSKKIELYGIKKLRELILDLAVRGLLLQQDPKEEPAGELLRQIAIEKAELLKKGKIKADKLLPPIDDVEKPFRLPSGWLWERLPNISFIQEGPGIMAKDFRGEGIPLIRISGMHGTLVSLNGCNFLDEDMVAKKWSHFRLEGDDILLSSSASLGKVSKVGNDAIGAIAYTGLIRFKPYQPLFDDYLIRFLGSNEFARQIDGSKKGAAIQHFGPTHLRWMVVPLPPLAEQYRIVAKVDELMALCDQLEQQADASLGAHQTLVATLLGALTSATDHSQFAYAWQRIAEHFDTLFTTGESIDQLKQAILQLGVTGKLVPQDLNDEPASELLDRISAEKTVLVKAGKIKKEKQLPPVADEEKLFSLPSGWEWCRLENLSLQSEAGWSPKCEETPRTGENWAVLKVSAVTWGEFNPAENKALPPNLDPVPDYEVKPGDFLISRANTAELVARSVVVQDQAPSKLMMSDKIIRFKFSQKVCVPYMSLFNNSGGARRYYLQVAGGTSSSMKNVSRLQIQSLVVALPPFSEQNRIVAKIDELMALCDQLTSRLGGAQTIQLYLADALTDSALARV